MRGSLVDGDEIKELRSNYAVVYPICFLCQSDGKEPRCKQPKEGKYYIRIIPLLKKNSVMF